MKQFTIEEVTVFKVTTFINDTLYQIYFLRDLRNIQVKVQIWTLKCDFNKE